MKLKVTALIVVIALLVGCAPALTPVIVKETIIETVEVEKVVVVEVTPVPTPDTRPFTWIHMGAGNPFYAIVSMGFLDACEDTGSNCKVFTSEGDDAAVAILNACDIMLADTGTAGLLIMRNDAAVNSCLEKIDAPWINFAPFNEAPGWISKVGDDPMAVAVMMAELMAESVDYEGLILLSQHSLDNAVSNAIVAKFSEIIEGYPGMSVSESVALGDEYTAQIGNANALLTRYPDAAGVFAGTAHAASTWTIVAQEHELEKGDLVIVGFDPIRENLDNIKAGWVTGVVGQNVYDRAYLAVELFIAYHNGEYVQKASIAPTEMVTLENVDDYYGIADRIDAYLASK